MLLQKKRLREENITTAFEYLKCCDIEEGVDYLVAPKSKTKPSGRNRISIDMGNFLVVSAISQYNGLPHEMVCSFSLEVFKQNLESHLGIALEKLTLNWTRLGVSNFQALELPRFFKKKFLGT